MNTETWHALDRAEKEYTAKRQAAYAWRATYEDRFAYLAAQTALVEQLLENARELIDALRPPCDNCEGKGWVPNMSDTWDILIDECPICKGTGKEP